MISASPGGGGGAARPRHAEREVKVQRTSETERLGVRVSNSCLVLSLDPSFDLSAGVTPGPMERAGVRAGERIVAVDGVPIRHRAELQDLLRGRAGDIVFTLVPGRVRPPVGSPLPRGVSTGLQRRRAKSAYCARGWCMHVGQEGLGCEGCVTATHVVAGVEVLVHVYDLGLAVEPSPHTEAHDHVGGGPGTQGAPPTGAALTFAQRLLNRLPRINSVTKNTGLGGAFHCAVEVYGHEWSFGFNSDERTGVFAYEPRKNPAHRYRETISLGATALEKSRVDAVLSQMALEWMGDTYDMLRRNCCHFCSEFAEKLGVRPLPGWTNRLANTGAFGADNWAKVRYYLGYSEESDPQE